MSKALVWIIAATLVIGVLATPSSAADVGAVVSACDKMNDAGLTCNYGIQGNALVGCTENVIFVCPADGTRQCTGSKNTSGNCNADGTTARQLPLRGGALLNELQKALENNPMKK
jgi:hypothetical protein